MARYRMGESQLVIVGIDAGDPGFIERWTAEGHLPAIASLMDRGSWARTGGPELVSEHGAWVSIFSGASRAEHGYYYFRQLRPGSYDLETVTGLDIDAPPFWSHLADRTMALLDVPDTRPLPGLRGIQLAHWATHNNWDPDRFASASEPPELLAEVRQRFAPKLVTVERHESSPPEDRAICRELLERVRTKGAMCRHVLADRRFDLIVTVFAETHTANHQFWRYGPGMPDGERVRNEGLEDAIREVYQAVDAEVGALLESLSAEANVVIVGSVGMRDDFPATGLIESFCRVLGYQAAPVQDGSRIRSPVVLARRLVPEPWRETVGRWLFSRDRREALLARKFRASTDWGRTRAFALPSAYTSFVRVNLRGREPLGIVEPGPEYEALLDRIELDLRMLVDPETGDPAVHRISRTTALFGGPPPASLPDLFVEWKAGRYMDRVLHPRGEMAQRRPDFFRRSDHSGEGFIVVAGPSVPRLGKREKIDVLDLTPTFLALMGEPVPDRLPGKVRADFVAA